MDEQQLQRKLLRQLKISNIFMGVTLAFVFVTMAVLGFLVFTVVTFVNDAKAKIDSIQSKTENTLDVKSQICGDNSLSQFVQKF